MIYHELGSYLAELRIRAGSTQAEVAAHLAVTDKAISQWERGITVPRPEQLVKLTKEFGVPYERLLNESKKKQKRIVKIVITGGPCAGKTSAHAEIRSHFEKKGYTVLIVQESATEMIRSGLTQEACGSVSSFQRNIFQNQVKKESIFHQAALNIDNEKILIVCDRGTLDNKAYMGALSFTGMINSFGYKEVELRDSYDAVFHLVSAADGAEEYYTLSNNEARSEPPEEARALDKCIKHAWVGHPHLRVIDNSSDFTGKMDRLIMEIESFMGDPEPYEIERKFLIPCPNLSQLEKKPNCERIEILQTYLLSNDPSVEERVRQRGRNNEYVFTHTKKRNISDVKRVEIERQIDVTKYVQLLMRADPTRRQIVKTRYCVMENDLIYELDVFSSAEWNGKALLEIELSHEDAPFTLPDWVDKEQAHEVTFDKAYTNAALAMIPGKGPQTEGCDKVPHN